MKTPDIRVPLILLIVIISMLAFCKSAPAAPLTSEQRALVTGLTANNKAMSEKIAVMTAQIEKDAATALFAEQKIASLQSRLIESKQNEEAQLQDLIKQQSKIQELADDRDRQVVRADAAQRAWEDSKAVRTLQGSFRGHLDRADYKIQRILE